MAPKSKNQKLLEKIEELAKEMASGFVGIQAVSALAKHDVLGPENIDAMLTVLNIQDTKIVLLREYLRNLQVGKK